MSQRQSAVHDSRSDLPAFHVREATPEDNAALLSLDRKSVVAAATPVAFDRSPDFFARSRVYPHWRAYVAEGEAGLIGVGAMALKSVLVDGQPVQAAYFYDLRVAPGFRRLGVAKAIGDAIRAYTRSLHPEVAYSLVMEGNVPSLSFVQGRGSRSLRSCVLSLIPVEAVSALESGRLRLVEEAEAESALRLAQAAHSDHDLFPFPDAASFGDRVRRVAGLGLRGMYGWQSDGSLCGCFGLWEYSPVMRMRLLQATGEWSWAAGRDLHQFFLMPLGFRASTGIAEAVHWAASLLRQDPPSNVARVLAVPHDVGDVRYAALGEFHPIRLGFTLFGLELGAARGVSLGSRPVYVDPADL